MATNEILGEAFETFLRSGVDSKGRTVGYVVGLREVANGSGCYAWVQKSIMVNSTDWKDFGATQRSRRFPDMASAKAWAYHAAKARAAK